MNSDKQQVANDKDETVDKQPSVQCSDRCSGEKKFRNNLEEFMRTGYGKHMHPVFAVMMLFSTFVYVILAVSNHMDGIYEDDIYTWFEKVICMFFAFGWLLEFYKAPNPLSFLKSKDQIQVLLVFIPVLAITKPDPFSKFYAFIVISRVVRVFLGLDIIVS